MVMEVTKRTYNKHKTEKKITISYELNTKLKPMYPSEDDIPRHPIYIRIRFRRNNTYLKSRIMTFCSQDNFANFLDNHLDLVKNETNIIEGLILELDAKYGENFNFTQFGDLYSVIAKPAYEYLSNLFMKELFEIIRLNNGGRPVSKATVSILTVKPDAIVYMKPLFRDLGIKIGEEYLEEISQLMLNYISRTKSKYNNFHLGRKYDFCLGDILSGFFQTEYIRYCGPMNDSSIKILNDIKLKFAQNPK